MIHYAIIEKGFNYKKEFIEEVEIYLKRGWKLVGGCQLNNYTYIQTLTKETKDDMDEGGQE